MSAMEDVAVRGAIEARCITLIARALGGIARREVTPDADFADDLNADSLDMVTIAMAAEDEFGVAISDDEAAVTETVAELVALIARKSGAEG